MANAGGTRGKWWRSPLQRLEDRFESDVRLGRSLILLVFVVATALVLPRLSTAKYGYEIGQPWAEPDLPAPFEYPIRKDGATLERQRRGVVSQVPRVFLRQVLQPAEAQASLDLFVPRLSELLGVYSRSVPVGDSLRAFERRAGVLVAPFPAPSADTWEELRANSSQLRELARVCRLAAERTYARPFLDRLTRELSPAYVSVRIQEDQERILELGAVHDPAQVGEWVEGYARELTPAVAVYFRQLTQVLLQPDYRYSEELYALETEGALEDVSPYEGVVGTGETIVARGERVSEEVARKIDSLNEELNQRAGGANGYLMFPGQLLVVALLSFLTVLFLRKDRRVIYLNNRKTALVFFIVFSMVVLAAVTVQATAGINSGYAVNFYYLVPLSMGAIMATVFFDDRVGYFVNILVAVLVGFVVHTSFELFFVQLCGGSVAIFNLTHLRRRSQFFTTAGSLLLTYAAAYLGYSLYLKGSLDSINYYNLFLFGLNVVITLATYPLIYLVEKLFGLTSDLTYIELLDTDHPVLKDLSVKAPGTWQHSLQVASISEAVANKIGANALQVRVGALFHDIGKMFQPDYFIENQSSDNPHEKLDPKVSAEVIINHVAYGEELARDHNLPKEIVDFIRTHHGTSRVEYFYRSYQRTNPECDENDFRYHGPLPTSKEMAILMLADACEAASRAMKRPTAEELKVLVDTIVSGKINDNQLVLARITFRDVYTIKSEILKILQNIYHTRVEYPSALPQPAALVPLR